MDDLQSRLAALKRAGATDAEIEAFMAERGDFGDVQGGSTFAYTPEEVAQERVRNYKGLGRSMLQGLTFGFGDEIEAGLRSAVSREKYGPTLEQIQRDQAAFKSKHPVAGTVAELGGGFASAIPGVGGAVAKAPGLLKKGVELAKVGAIYGGVAGAGTAAPGAENRLKGAAMGAGIGAVATPVLAGTGAALLGAGKLGAHAFGLTTKAGRQEHALEQLAKAFADAGLTPDEVAQQVAARRAAGDADLVLGQFLGQPGQQALKGATTIPNPANKEIFEGLDRIKQGASGRLLGTTERATGIQQQNIEDLAADLIAKQKAKAAPLYQAVDQIGPMDLVSDEADAALGYLTRKMPRLTQDVMEYIAEEGIPMESVVDESGRLSPKYYDILKKAIDARLFGKARGSADDLAWVKMNRRQILRARDALLRGVDESVQRVTGQDTYKVAREAWAGDEEAKAALKLGRRAFSGSKTADQVRAELAGMSPSEVELYRTAALDAYRTKLLNKTTSPVPMMEKNQAFRERLRAVFGDAADQVEEQVASEAQKLGFANALHGSDTAPRLASMDDQGWRPAIFGNLMEGRIKEAGREAFRRTAAKGFRNVARDRAAETARALTAGTHQPGDLDTQLEALKAFLTRPPGKAVASSRASVGGRGLLARLGIADESGRIGPLYHGSPHKFEPHPDNPLGKFDASKIGTGEGAQAYGHGLYFTESPEIARHYQEGLAGLPRTRRWLVVDGQQYHVNELKRIANGHRSPLGDILRRLRQTDFTSPGQIVGALGHQADAAEQAALYWDDRAVQFAARKPIASTYTIDDFKRFAENERGVAKSLRDFLGRVEVGEATSQPGALYTVELPAADDADFLVWDKPLSEQPPKVREAMESLPMPMREAWKKSGAWEHVHGEQLYQELTRPSTWPSGAPRFVGKEDNVSASELLRQRGVRGIKYLDGSSRASGSGSYNFVVFPGEEGGIQITGREGTLGPGGLSMMSSMAGGLGGGAYGATQGETREERIKNALLYGAAGAAGGYLLGRGAERFGQAGGRFSLPSVIGDQAGAIGKQPSKREALVQRNLEQFRRQLRGPKPERELSESVAKYAKLDDAALVRRGAELQERFLRIQQSPEYQHGIKQWSIPAQEANNWNSEQGGYVPVQRTAVSNAAGRAIGAMQRDSRLIDEIVRVLKHRGLTEEEAYWRITEAMEGRPIGSTLPPEELPPPDAEATGHGFAPGLRDEGAEVPDVRFDPDMPLPPEPEDALRAPPPGRHAPTVGTWLYEQLAKLRAAGAVTKLPGSRSRP